MSSTKHVHSENAVPKDTDLADAPRARAVEQTYKPARQKRSVQSEQKLLAAAEALFADHGFEGTKVGDIIKKSGCSIGSFYHRFGDKDGLAKVMVDRYITDAVEIIGASDFSKSKHGDLRTMLRFLSQISCAFMTTRLGVYRAAHRLAQNDPEIWTDTGNLSVLLRNRVVEFLPAFEDEIKAPDPEAAMTQALQLILLVILQTRLGSGALFPRDDDTLLNMLTNAALGILSDGAT
ncbi:TetR/AcrR family transcriptional regulator [Ruegeria halocynthiae]|uniref:TetR/AcrR family transcriptional regulator n=1 Tax=Ruegeria halocynthiae TaxID=985054 RepID=UPI00055B62F0|nr:TetR/AcrR family transcriptional regulator [Ruegeria halocynthiae]